MLSTTFAACCSSAVQQSDAQVKGGGKGVPGKPAGGVVTRVSGRRFAIADMSRGWSSPKFDVRAQYGTMLYILMAGVLVLLVIACANVGTLLLARAAAR